MGLLGGEASSAVGQTGGGEGRCGGITGSLLLVLAVYSVGIVLCMGRGGRGGGLNLCVNLVGGCVDSAVRKILLPRKIYCTVTAPPNHLTHSLRPPPPPPTCATVVAT